MTPRTRIRYLTLKLRALCWVLRRLRAGGGEFAAKNKHSCHCENDYCWQHIRHEGILRRFRRQAGEAFDRKGQPHAPPATKRTSPRQKCWTRHFVKTSTMSRPGI